MAPSPPYSTIHHPGGPMPPLVLVSGPCTAVPAEAGAGAGESSDSPRSICSSCLLSVVFSGSAGPRSQQREGCRCKELFIRNSGFRTARAYFLLLILRERSCQPMKTCTVENCSSGANGAFTVTEWEPLYLTTMRDMVVSEIMGENQALLFCGLPVPRTIPICL